MKFRRLSEIENYLNSVGNISLDKLCEVFSVSKNTIRRDIAELEKRGSIRKVYGGIVSTKKNTPEPFKSREVKNQKEKKIAAELACQLVHDNDVIFIDSGTTTMHMIPFLAARKNLTIITYNLHVIIAAMSYPNLNVIATGGELHREANSFVGINTINFLKNYNIAKAFLASTGISLTSGVTNVFPAEYQIKKYMMEAAPTSILMVDHTKINIASLMTYCRLEDMNYVVVDSPPPQEYIDFFAQNQIVLLTGSQNDE